MIVSSAPTSTEERAVMHSNLVGGQWFVDNNKLQEQVSLAHRVSHQQSFYAPLIRNFYSLLQVDSGRIPRLLPIKSYRDEIFNLTVSTFLLIKLLKSKRPPFLNNFLRLR